MPRSTAGIRLLVADPNSRRRTAVLEVIRKDYAGEILAIEAASLAEAFDLAESQEPNAIAVAVELSGDPGLPMFLRLVDAISAAFLLFGEPARNRAPKELRHSIECVQTHDADTASVLANRFRGIISSSRATRNAVALGKEAGCPPACIVIGASTGGVSAIETVLAAFPSDCPPTLVVQHIRAGFVEGMAARLDARCAPRVTVARDGEPLDFGHVFIASDPERHLTIQDGGSPRCRLKPGPPRHGHRPCVDALFETAAALGKPVSAALLTGMGADGAAGMARIKAAGGFTIAQDEATSVVFGMPRMAIEAGVVDRVLPIGRIAAALLENHSSASSLSGREEYAR